MKELIEAQRNYFLEGHTRSLQFRKKTLRKLHDLLLKYEIMLADAIYSDFRKSFYATVENELSIPYGEINRVIRKLGRWSRPNHFRTNMVNFPASSRTVPAPYGVSLVIGTWNYPYMLSLVPAISSLAAGNTVVLKPSEVSSNSSRALAELINSSFPRELFHVVEGGAQEATRLLKLKFDKIFFTGSSRVGRIVMKAAAEHLTPVTLELGGKNPVIVMPDCNLKMTARRLTWGKFHNNGTSCVSPDHLFVHESIKDDLVREMSRQIKRIYGEDPRESPMLPRMINRAHFDRVSSLIDPGKVVYGGGCEVEDLYIEPTILDHVDPADPVMQEEVFGPVLPVLTYSNLEQLVSTLKRQPAPLVIYVFSGNVKRAKRIIREIPSGNGMINEVVLLFINMNTPFGGRGESGMGSYHGRAGFDAFSHHKTILTKPNWFELFLKYPPYRDFNLRILRAVMGKSLRNFWR